MLQNIVRVLHEPVLQKYWWRHIFLKHILEMSKSLYWLLMIYEKQSVSLNCSVIAINWPYQKLQA